MSQEKLFKILQWYENAIKQETDTEVCKLAQQEDASRIEQVEELLEESMPHHILDLYTKYDGEKGTGYGSFLGHSFVNLNKMKNSLEFSKTQVKPENPSVVNEAESNAILKKLIETVTNELPIIKKYGFIKQKWYKVEFTCSPSSRSGPYFYPSESTTSKERTIIKLTDSASKSLYSLAKELHAFELETYNWDTMDVIAYGNGKYEVKRTYFNFEEGLSSYPEGAIKQKYYHIKWLPLIADGGGNFIGIDLDPGENGIKGQVIVFGRDEQEMFVVSNSWDEFLDFNLGLIEKGGAEFLKESHLHDIYKGLIKG